MKANPHMFWSYDRPDVRGREWLSYPTQKAAFLDTARERLAERLEVPVDGIEQEIFDEYTASLVNERDAAALVNLSEFHRLWPDILQESEVEPEFEIMFRRSQGNSYNQINRSRYYSLEDVPKLLMACSKHERPEGAKTLYQVSSALDMGTSFVDGVLRECGIELVSFRDPETLEFDEYLTAGAIKSLLVEVGKRKKAFSASSTTKA